MEVRWRGRGGMCLGGPGGQVRVLLVRASTQDPLLEMRGRQIRWKCAHMQGRNVPQRAFRAEVRKKAGEGMCLGGAWEGRASGDVGIFWKKK